MGKDEDMQSPAGTLEPGGAVVASAERTEADQLADRLLPLYRNEIRPILEEHKAPALEAVDRLAEVLERARARKARLHFGFVGESQVGKSTLINALVGVATLPAGGIGPLTAQATEVAYADENSMSVRYHTRTKLNQLAFALERYLVSRGDLAQVQAGAEVVELDDDVSVVEAGAEEGDRRTEKGETFLQQARLMLTGSDKQEVSLSGAALVAGLRAILGHALSGDVADELAPHQERIETLQRKLQTSETLTQDDLGSGRAFRQELKLRAAGALAPLVAELKVRMNMPFLRYATLVDLPGIGVVGDPAAQVADHFVRSRGDALIVVIRNNGLPATIADLLERTGVITKLLFGASDREPPIRVLIAVTHLDSVAKDRYSVEDQEAQEADEPPPDRHAIFDALAGEMRDRIRSQVETALRNSAAFEDLPDDQRVRREEIVSRLCDRLDVMVVAANDFLQITNGREDLAFLKRPEGTGIPQFRQHVQQISTHLASTRDAAIVEAAAELRDVLEDHLAMIAGLYEEGGGRASADWARFREELGQALTPLREQMKAHHGEIIATLRSTLPTKLQILCKNAEKIATQKLHRLRKRGAELHYKSLEAALRYGGVWERRAINYPEAITRAYVDSIASEWEPTIVEGIRAAMRSLAERDVALVEEMCARAATFDERIVADAHIETQKKLLRQQSRSCLAWTRERLDQLREDVQEKLIDEVREPIQKAASKALQRGANRGQGAKTKILEAFEEGGQAAIERANERAGRILGKYYDQLYGELNSGYLSEYHDPLQAAYDALTKDELVRARRSDAQRRRRVLDAVTSYRAALAGLLPAGSQA